MSIDVNTRMSQIQEVLENAEFTTRSSFFQLQHFQINSQPTLQAKMWQCLRELKNKWNTIRQINIDKEELQDNISLAEIELERTKKQDPLDNYEEKEKEIKLRKIGRRINAAKLSLEELNKKAKEELEEASFYLKAFKYLEEKEPLKPLDDPSAQREYWNEKLTQELNISLLVGLLNRPVSMELVKTIFALNDDAPIKQELINIVRQAQIADEARKTALLENSLKKQEN